MGADEQLRAAAETLDGPTLEWARATARELGVDLVAGSILERVDGQEKLANTSVHVDPAGEIKAVYRKLHMFDVEVGGRTYRESDTRGARRGDRPVRRRADGVELGMSICYDLRFPELLSHPRRARRARPRAAGRLHARDDARPLGDAAARASDREPGVRDRGQSGRRASRRTSLREAVR